MLPPNFSMMAASTHFHHPEASEAHSRESLSRNRRLPACYRSGEVYNLAKEDEEEGREDDDEEGDIDEEEE